jgi:TRAP-type transport system periplasmic protein
MKRIALILIFLSVLMASPAAIAKEIKMAILAPEGTTWHKTVVAWSNELSQKTAGRVKLKLYAGGVLGDEKDVIRKMRIGQIHAAGFTGLGLGLINPNVRVLELPMLVSNYREADALAKSLQPKLEKGFGKKGFVLLGWVETGFVNIFSTKKPIRSVKDMERLKMWAWEGDQLVEEMYKVFKIVPTPLPLTDVLTSLQTNLLNAVYAPPLAAIALQWFTQTKYMSDLKLTDSTGGILITKKALAGLSAADQAILKSTARKYARKLVVSTRKENGEAYKALEKAGVETVHIPKEAVDEIRETSKKVWAGLVGRLYSQELLDAAIAAVGKKRSGSTEK